MMLSPEQFNAVTRTGQDVCVVAGPGSGKTRVLVKRFRYLVDHGIPPLRILAITYTEKAANEIKRRLVAQFEDAPGFRQQIERAYVSTVHGFCARLLRENAISAGLNPEFRILEQRASRRELTTAILDVLDQLYHDRPENLRALLTGWAAADPVASLREVYEVLRITGRGVLEQLAEMPVASADAAVQQLLNAVQRFLLAASGVKTETQRQKVEATREWLARASLLGERPVVASNFSVLESFPVDLRGKLPEDHPFRQYVPHIKDVLIPVVRRALLTEFYEAERSTLVTVLRRMHERYQRRKNDMDALDFDDLQERAIRLLREDAEVRRAVQTTFEAVMMDELQDTNPLQWQLMDLVRRPDRFFGVGDANQSIYGFRHADPEVFAGYRRQLAGRGQAIDFLLTNYRSRREILAAVQAVVGSAAGIEPHELLAGREFPPSDEPPVEILVAMAEDTSRGTPIEAAVIAHRIRELVERGTQVHGERRLQYADIAILVRNANSLFDLEQALQRFQVPYVMSRGRTFFEEQEVLDLINWLHALANSGDEVSLLAVLRSPLVGVGDETILRLRLHGPLGEALERLPELDVSAFDEQDLSRLQSFRELYRTSRQQADDVLPDRLLARALDAAGYYEDLSPQARANIDKLFDLLRSLIQAGHPTLPELVAELDELREAEGEPNAPVTAGRDAVQVMTMHSAKGLEFPVVFLAALQKGISPKIPDLTYSPSTGLGVRWRDPHDREPASDPAHAEYTDWTRVREDREADRLFYVAMTRAEERLVFCWVNAGRGGSRWPAQVLEGLGLRLGIPSPQPEILTCSTGDPVRMQVFEEAPQNTFAPPQSGSLPEPVVLPPPVLDPQHEEHLQLDAVARYWLCPRQYYLADYLSWHRETRSHEEEPPVTPEEFSLEGEVWAPRLMETIIGLRLQRATRVERDIQFVLRWDHATLQGKIDLWFEEAGERVLVSVGPEGNHRLPSAALETRAFLQAAALSHMESRAADRILVFEPSNGKLIDLPATTAPERSQHAITNLLTGQSHLHFPQTPGPHCEICAYFGHVCKPY